MKKINLFIGGQYRDFYFGLGFLGNLIEKSGVGMHEIDAKISENPFKWMPEIMFHSVAFGFIRKNETIPFTAFDVTDWIDADGGFDSKVVIDFFAAFRQSLVKDVPIQPDTKKKVNKK